MHTWIGTSNTQYFELTNDHVNTTLNPIHFLEKGLAKDMKFFKNASPSLLLWRYINI